MKINPINIPNRIVTACNSIGNHIYNIPGNAKEYLKSDSFKALKGKVDKNTLIGAGVVAGALILAIKTIKSMKKELDNIKNK